MSLTSFLLKSKSSGKKTTPALDTELDDIFRTDVTEDRAPSTTNDKPVVEKKKKRRSDVHADEPDTKRAKRSLPEPVQASPSVSSPQVEKKKKKKSPKKRVEIAPEPASDSDGPGPGEQESSKRASASEESSDEDADPSNLVHETLQKNNGSKSEKDKTAGRKSKFSPADETKEKRDARTIFIGNITPEVAGKRSLQKQLQKHILALIPTAKIESTRFRSVAFQAPTAKLPDLDEGKKDKQPRQHDRDRTSSWREAQAGDESKTNEKKFLTPGQKKKIAFINHEIHSDADSVHAYIVFAYPHPPESRPANLPPPPSVMDPFEAARLAIEKCNGTMFMDRMLRVDAVMKKSSAEGSSDVVLPNSAIGDPKLTVFVGNLDFASKEEDLRVFFEGAVSAERGPPGADVSQDEDKPKVWVTRVRMIRDKDTQLGKGFAYVQFADRTCVDEILALEPGKLKFAKRKLRVQRCKTIPGAPPVKTTQPPKATRTTDRAPVPSVPKGDPSLGERLASFSKEERKKAKATDPDRVARRMAKKKARIALAQQGVPVQGKERERVRKPAAAKKAGGVPPKKTSKGRIRSEKSIVKRNTKK